MLDEKEIIQYYIQRLYDRNLTTMSGGNLSVKGQSGVYVTPSSVDKGTLTTSDIMEVLYDGSVIGKHKVTSEYPVHEEIYSINKGKNAVLHSHTTSILGMSVARKIPEISILDDVYIDLDKQIGIAHYAEPGTQKLADETVAILNGKRKVAILENHGLFIVDDSMEKCYDQLENLDLICRIQSNVGKLGGELKRLSEYRMNQYRSYSNKIYEKDETIDKNRYEDEKTLVVELLNRLYKRHICTSKNVCFSYKLCNGDIIVNPYDRDITQLTPDDLNIVVEGKYCGIDAPHKDLYLHESIYSQYKNINCVITTRPPYIMAYGASTCEYTTKVVPECYGYLRDIDKFKFMYGEELCESLKSYFDDFHRTAIVENSMFIVTGPTPMDAYDRLEVAEATAEAIIETYPIAKPIEMDDKAIKEMEDKLGISR